MFRAIPVSNKICFDKQIKRNWKIHEQKLSQIKIKSQFSKQKSEDFTFLELSKKRNTIKDIKNRQLQRSNYILFNKIQSIQTKGNKNSYLNLKNQIYHIQALHDPFRKRQFFKILKQNRQMIKRIKDKKSSFDIRKMQQQRKNVEKNISLISEFKYKHYPLTRTKVNFYVTDQKLPQKKQQKAEDQTKNSHNHPRYQTNIKKINQCVQYFSRTSRFINKKHYSITTYQNKNLFYIEVQDLQNNSNKYRMKISQQQLQKFLGVFYKGNLKNFVNNLQIDIQNEFCFLKLKKNQKSITEQKQNAQNIPDQNVTWLETNRKQS